MTRAGARLAFDVRAYRDEDEPAVLRLLQESMGAGPAGDRSAEFFRWKHLENPFGRSFMILGEAGGELIGLRAFMRWRFLSNGRTVRAVRAVDTATHPAYRGRGVFSTLTLAALEALRGETDLVFNTPNEKSLPGYLKMGWRTVGKMPIWIRVRRPIRFAMGLRSLAGPPVSGIAPDVRAEPAPEVLRDERLGPLLADATPVGRRLATPWNLDAIRWRYADASLLDYRAVRAERNGRLHGIALFRVRARGPLWETTLSDVIVRPGDRSAARSLLRRAIPAARVDHLACHFPAGSAARRAAIGSGFVPAPAGMTFVVNPLGGGHDPDPMELGSWALSLGDLEVF